MAVNATFNSNKTIDASGTNLTYILRHGAMSSMAEHDYYGDLNKAPLVIRSPKVGGWFIAVLTSLSKALGGSSKICYSITWQLLQCRPGKAGLNCTCERYVLETVLRRDSFLSNPINYLPVNGKVSPDSANSPVEALSSNTSYGGELDNSWTYFLLNIPRGAAGGNIHVRLTSDTKINYEIYARVGGVPSLDIWDYYYANRTKSTFAPAIELMEALTVASKLYHIKGTYDNRLLLLYQMLQLCFLHIGPFFRRWQIIRRWFKNLLKTLWRRFRWGFVLAGFAALMAAISWKAVKATGYDTAFGMSPYIHLPSSSFVQKLTL